MIIPVYNEEATIEHVVRGLSKQFSNIICVDDGSTDSSALLIQKSKAQLVTHSTNKGQGAALRTGIENALKNPNNAYFVTFDSDGQHSPDDAQAMLDQLKQQRLDIVLGSRFLGRVEGLPIKKLVVLKIAIKFSNLTTGLKLTDTHNGLRVFNRSVATKLRLTCSGMAHASEIIYRVAENKFTYGEAPVTIKYSAYSKSKGQSIFNAFNILREIVLYRIKKQNT